jgi:predicted nucleic acid-binding protein
MFLLDTNVISELCHGKPHQSTAVRAWAVEQPVQQLYLSSITVLELEMGVLRMERYAPGSKRCSSSSMARCFRLRRRRPGAAP